MNQVRIQTIQAREIATSSRLPEADWVINPYVGCLHACRYCYATFMRRFTGHTGENWGEFLDVKDFDDQALRRKLQRLKAGTVIFIGSVTDAYQAAERKFGVTRRILEILVEFPQHQVSTLTKSDLVLRDQDLWAQLPGSSIGFSVSSHDPDYRRWVEPRAISADRRLRVCRELRTAGLDTYAFFGPIMPTFTDLEELLSIWFSAVSGAMAEALNLRCGNRGRLEETLAKHFPGKRETFFEKAVSPLFWEEQEHLFRVLCEKHGIVNLGFFRHGA